MLLNALSKMKELRPYLVFLTRIGLGKVEEPEVDADAADGPQHEEARKCLFTIFNFEHSRSNST